MTRLWDKGAPLDERVLAYTAGDDYALDERLVKYDVRASIAHAEMLNAAKLLSDADLDAIREGLNALAAEHARGPVEDRARPTKTARPRWRSASPRASAPPAVACIWAARATTRC